MNNIENSSIFWISDEFRQNLRGERVGDKVQCLGCSTEKKKKFYTASGWNRHCRGQHMQAAEQSAVSASQRDTVQYTGNDNSVVVNAGEELISKAPPNKAQLPLSSSKKLDSPSFGNESTVPSTKSASKEAQAGKQSSSDPRKSRKCSITFSNEFSEKNATTLT